ncbi:DUF6502 family protein [Methyloversatilis discipulorum]|uniref:DUF6502 family protein n=1 Tax=Methyloversatilis discipulorum TaxID=1119528 RepID=UPI001A612ECF|nr:DUF6502 family protein [Methyloversatilis discipulorum]MBL8467085.1 hypothetical protein [Methyloversatilis discipulorum]
MTDPSSSAVLTSTLRAVLRPVVRLMLARGVTLPLAVELLKRVFVQVALENAGREGPVTDSRVSLQTGVHRKDVKRLRSLPSAHADLPRNVSLGAQLISRWVGQAPWRDAAGGPRPLPRLASAGGGTSFEALVASVSKDIRARPVLDEWLRLGIAHLNARDEVVLNAGVFASQDGDDEQLARFARQVGDHAMAAVDNLLGHDDPWFERGAHYRGLSTTAVSILHARAAELGAQALQSLEREAGADARSADDAGRHLTVGVYVYAEQDRRR